MDLTNATTLVWALALVGGFSVVVARALKVSYLLTVVLAVIPFGLPALEDRFYPQQTSAYAPEVLMIAGWALAFLLLVVWSVMRPVVSALVGKFGVVRIAHGTLLLSAVLVSILLVIDPSRIGYYIPFWSTGLGVSLLGATLVSMALALVRTLRASLFFVIWSCVSVVLASEVFLHKPLFTLTRDDLSEIVSVDSSYFEAMTSQPKLWIEGVFNRFVVRSKTDIDESMITEKYFPLTETSLRRYSTVRPDSQT